MKTIDLERRRFLRQMDKAYPKENSPGFTERVKLVWQNLDDDYYIEKLSQEFKPNRGKINKLTLFYLWLILCFQQPWEKDEKCRLSEKRLDSLSGSQEAANKDIWGKINNIFEQQKDFLNYPEMRTLRNYMKREDFMLIAAWIAVDQKPLIKLGKTIIRLKNKMRSNWKQFKKIDFKRWKLISKFIKFLKSQKYISKRDLMRKLGINKKDCDSLLREAESRGFIKVKKYSNNSVWIIYTGL
jgi:ribosomal protein S25